MNAFSHPPAHAADEALFLTRLLETCPDCIYLCDVTTRRASFRTHSLWQQLGYDRSEVDAPDAVIPQQFLLEEDQVDVDALFARLEMLDTGRWIDVHFRMRSRAGGVRHFRSRMTPLSRDAAGWTRHVLGSITDVTAQKEGEAAVEAARVSAEHASRAKTHFLADLAHELRTPLQGVIGAQDLLARSSLDAGQAKLLRSAQDASEQLTALVDDALDIAAVEAGRLVIRPHPFSPDALGASLLQVFAPRAAAQGLQLALAVEPGLPACVLGDARRIRQIVGNFLNNAVKFTVKGGITLRLRSRPLAGFAAALQIAVEDTGPGIAAAQHEAVFERFHRGETAQEQQVPGSGLGLAIAKELAEAMGGRVGLRSAVGEGAVFFLDLSLPIADVAPQPRLDGQGASAAAVLGHGGGGQGADTWDDPTTNGSASMGPAVALQAHGFPSVSERPLVMIVDDNEANLQLAGTMVQICGCRVCLAGSGDEALRRVRDEQPQLILLDYRMPGLTGLEVARRMRAAGVTARIMLLTANAGSLTPREQAGIDGLLLKPLRLRDLKRHLQMALASDLRAAS